MTRKIRLGAAAALALLALPAFASTLPLPVSPGGLDRFLGAPTACPAMSWTLAEGATAYELALFPFPAPAQRASLAPGEHLPAEWTRELGDPVWRHSLPAGASHWQPSVERCPAPAGRYVWSVRARHGDGWTDWSPPAFFTTPGLAEHRPPPSPSVPPAASEEGIAPAAGDPAVLVADGFIESTSDGFRFPDGSEQKKAFTRDVFHAVVAANGTKLAGNVVSTSKTGTGVYSIGLGRLGIACSAVGNGAVYDPPDTPFIVPQIIVTPIVDPSSLSITVNTYFYSTGALIDTSFMLVVVCPPFVLF